MITKICRLVTNCRIELSIVLFFLSILNRVEMFFYSFISGLMNTTPAFFASLYMLRSQALNQVALLNASYNQQNRGQSCAAQRLHPPFPRPPLQQSNSVVTSTGIICKLCRYLIRHYVMCNPSINSNIKQQQTTFLPLVPDLNSPQNGH